MDPIWNQRQLLAETMGQAWRELQAAHQEVEFNLEAWRSSMAFCGIYDIVYELVKNASGDFSEAVELANKILTGALGNRPQV